MCRRVVGLWERGDFRTHGPKNNRCIGSRRTPEQAARYILPVLTSEQMDVFRSCWLIGDPIPVVKAFGVEPPFYWRKGRTLDEELAWLVQSTRDWLQTLVSLSNERSCTA